MFSDMYDSIREQMRKIDPDNRISRSDWDSEHEHAQKVLEIARERGLHSESVDTLSDEINRLKNNI